MIAVLVILIPIYWKWKGGDEFRLDSTLTIILIALIIVWNIPSVFLYLNFYFENKNTSFSLNHNSKTIVITQNGITKTYGESDVKESIYHLGIYYKNAIDKAGRIPMLDSDFGYWEINFKNGDRYFLTNILHDFIHDEPFYNATLYRFRIFSYVKKSDSSKGKDIKNLIEENRDKTITEKFVKRFQTKSELELNEMINNQSKYQKEAIEAVKIVLKSKNVG